MVNLAPLCILLVLALPALGNGDSKLFYESPLGACEVSDLSLKRMKRELRKRGTECVGCTDKKSHGLALISLINMWFHALTEKEYQRLEQDPTAPWIAGNLKTVEDFRAELAATNEQAPDPDAWKSNYLSRLVGLYQAAAPDQIKNVKQMLAKWKGKEEAMLQSVMRNYGMGQEALQFRTPAAKLPLILAKHGVDMDADDDEEEPVAARKEEL
jgi:hypothetical protein